MKTRIAAWTVSLSIVALSSVANSEPAYPRYGCRPGQDHYPFCDVSLPIEQRVEDLIGRLTLDEKPLLLVARLSPLGNVSRLGVPQYDWGGNCVHGVQSRCGTGSNGETRCPTSFPNPNALGATFNESVWHGMGRVIGRELRSLWKQGVGEEHPPTELPPIGLDCWSPNINIVRDPRWGRNLETASEDPFLLGLFGVAVTQGLQVGEDSRYLQAIVTLKHFIANSLEGSWPGPGGPASYPGTGLCPGGTCTRFTIDPNISAYDLASSYMPAFKTSVVQGGALGVMCSYNSVNGVPSCANKWLLEEKLRKEWGFEGYVTGDSGAVEDIWRTHFYAATEEDSVTFAVRSGTDVQSALWKAGQQPWNTSDASYIRHIPTAVRSSHLSEEAVDTALRHTLTLRFRLGLFDPPEGQVYEQFSPDEVRSDKHVAAAMDAAEQSLVLLKNDVLDGVPVLPIRSGKVAVIGPHAMSRYPLLGNYLGQICPQLNARGTEQYGCVESILEAIGNLSSGAVYAPGLESITSSDSTLFDEALRTAQCADHVVLALGLDTISIEAEGLDRHNITLPEGQLELFRVVLGAGKPVTVVLLNGGIVASEELKQHASAIVEAWYPGFYGARAIAKALLGLTNRWGKLPVTIYDESFTDHFDMLDFDMTKGPGRTYRYFTGKPLWPFGFGLSFTTFALKLVSDKAITVSQSSGKASLLLEIQNSGSMAGDDVVMAFFRPLPGTLPAGCRAALLQKQLFGFRRVSLPVAGSASVEFALTAATLQVHADNGDRVSYAGRYEVILTNGLQSLSVDVEVESVGSPQPVTYERWVPQPNDQPPGFDRQLLSTLRIVQLVTLRVIFDLSVDWSVLGRGSYGQAVLVKERHGGKKCVVKEIDLSRMPAAAQREAQNEVGVLKSLQHPNIVAYFDAFVEATKLYIVMEYADGGDLSASVKKRKADAKHFSEIEALTTFAQCCLALQHVHRKHILHRDLKCQNIFLTLSGVVKLGDFGIAKVLDHTAAEAITMIGTPIYLAPEVCHSKPYGVKADVWSLGVVLYELLALEPPFAGSNIASLINNIVTGTPKPVSTALYGEGLRELLSQMLNKQPQGRPTVEQVLGRAFVRSVAEGLPGYVASPLSGFSGDDVTVLP
ncbi:unnamed protein product, partial [Polarella glacialis]